MVARVLLQFAAVVVLGSLFFLGAAFCEYQRPPARGGYRPSEDDL